MGHQVVAFVVVTIVASVKIFLVVLNFIAPPSLGAEIFLYDSNPIQSQLVSNILEKKSLLVLTFN